MSRTILSDEGINQKLLKLLNTGSRLLKKRKQSRFGHRMPKHTTKRSFDQVKIAGPRISNQEKQFQQSYLQALLKLKLCQTKLTRIPPHLYQTSGTKDLPLQNYQAHVKAENYQEMKAFY